MVEKEAIKLDNDIKEVKGKTTDDIDKLLLEISKLEEEQTSLKEEIANYSDAIQQFDKELKTLQEKMLMHLKRTGENTLTHLQKQNLFKSKKKILKLNLKTEKKRKKRLRKRTVAI